MKNWKKFIGILLLGLLVSCGSENTKPEVEKGEEIIEDEAYFKALETKAKIDSTNASLEWNEIKPGLWMSNNGQLGILDSRMLYVDSMIIVTDYITKIDSSSIVGLINTTTFEYLGNNFYKDAYQIYLYRSMAYGGTFSIFDADRESFHVVGDCYARDINHVYTEKGQVIEEADYYTFFSMQGAGCFAKDENHYYFWDEKIDMEMELDSLSNEMIQLLDVGYNAMDTIHSAPTEWEMNASTGKTKITFDQYNLKINSLFETVKINPDTVVIYEDLGEYLVGRSLSITPKNESDTFHLYLSTVDYVNNMMESDSNGYVGDWEDFEHFGFTDTSQLFYWHSNKDNQYIFPDIGYDRSQIMQTRARDFGFRDTTYWYHGEMYGQYFGHAWLYEKHIVDYWIYTAFVKIERHNNGLRDVKWLRIEFSYGC